MVVMSMPNNINDLAVALQEFCPDVLFVKSDKCLWSPKDRIIYFDTLDKPIYLIHEVGHALLGHNSYDSDLELLMLESAAWAKAKEIAQELGVALTDDEAEDSLDTYRAWLHKRSLCPTCDQIGIQTNLTRYACINCPSTWIVSKSRFCRAYRKQDTAHIRAVSRG